jgi:hypothetical protein
MAASKKKKTTKARLPQLVKPKKHTQTFWDYNEVAEYLEKLHGKDFRDCANKSRNPTAEYQDFWHWIVEINDGLSNGSFIHLPDLSELDDPDTADWQKEIMQHFMDFLGDDYDEKLWVSW